MTVHEIQDRAFPAHVNPATGEKIDPRIHNVATSPWPPKSNGPLPPDDSIPPDLNIGTAQDEIDAWAHEHDAASEKLAVLRRELSATAPDGTDSVEIQVMKARAVYRRQARANPRERGRRTSGDIDEEVNEKLADDRWYRRKLDLETEIAIALDRLFRARDNVTRLQKYIDSLPRNPANHRP